MTDPTSAPFLSQYRAAVVADPFPVHRSAVASLLLLAGAADNTVEADSPRTALEAVRRTGAAMLITEVDLVGRGDGIQLCRQVKRLARPPLVLVFTASGDPAVVAACLAGGADGFVHRSASTEQLVRAVEALGAGRPVWYLSENRAHEQAKAAGPPRVHGMTLREQEVLGLLLARFSNDEIAAELHLARQTVKNHVSSLLRKIGVTNRRELLATWGASAGRSAPARAS